MNKIQIFLFAVILISIATKVSLISEEKVQYAALSTDTKREHIEQFFKYKVNNLPEENSYRAGSCMIQTVMCYHT